MLMWIENNLWVMVPVGFVLAVAYFLFWNRPKEDLYDKALLKDGEIEFPTRTIPRETKAGTSFPMSEVTEDEKNK